MYISLKVCLTFDRIVLFYYESCVYIFHKADRTKYNTSQTNLVQTMEFEGIFERKIL